LKVRQIVRRNDRRINRQVGGQASERQIADSRQTDGQMERMTDRQKERPTIKPIDQQTGQG
jgi:hypothetical protein